MDLLFSPDQALPLLTTISGASVNTLPLFPQETQSSHITEQVRKTELRRNPEVPLTCPQAEHVNGSSKHLGDLSTAPAPVSHTPHPPCSMQFVFLEQMLEQCCLSSVVVRACPRGSLVWGSCCLLSPAAPAPHSRLPEQDGAVTICCWIDKLGESWDKKQRRRKNFLQHFWVSMDTEHLASHTIITSADFFFLPHFLVFFQLLIALHCSDTGSNGSSLVLNWSFKVKAELTLVDGGGLFLISWFLDFVGIWDGPRTPERPGEPWSVQQMILFVVVCFPKCTLYCHFIELAKVI